MAVAFYVLLKSEAPPAVKAVFTALPISIWAFGGFAVYREYREQENERRKEKEIVEEAKQILNSKGRFKDTERRG